MPLFDVLDPERRLVGVTPRGPLCLPPGGAHWYAVREIGLPGSLDVPAARTSSPLPGSTGSADDRASRARTVIGGFSQGAVMSYALALGRGRPRPAAMLAL